MFGAKKTSVGTETTDNATPKTAFERLLTTTPVVMTVVATLLAGLSSSEMTQAQYYRSLAAQNQSKVGDQWSFFQAKRIRGTSHDLTVKLLNAQSDGDAASAEELSAGMDNLIDQLNKAQNATSSLLQTVAAMPAAPGVERVRKSAEQLRQTLEAKLTQAKQLQHRTTAALADPEVKNALAFLQSNALPVPPVPADSPETDPSVEKALAEIAQRKSEIETESVVRSVHTAALHKAIMHVENNVRALDEAIRPIAANLTRIDKMVAEQAAIAKAHLRAVIGFRNSLEQLPSTAAKSAAHLRQTSMTWLQDARSLKEASAALQNAFAAAQLGFESRRYKQEALDNQRAAGLFEIEVRKNSFNSERHRRRSGFYFYGMLAAQCGVTIASLALAVRLKSVLWGIASAAGVIAIIIGAYVYVYV